MWPIIRHNGEKMTREFPWWPIAKTKSTTILTIDRSGSHTAKSTVIDFWAEGEKMGKDRASRGSPTLRWQDSGYRPAKNVWKSADGKPVLSDRRRFTFGSGPDQSRYIDCEVLLLASEVICTSAIPKKVPSRFVLTKRSRSTPERWQDHQQASAIPMAMLGQAS